LIARFQKLRRHRPTVVINAAAYTAVDRAETEEVLATTINGAAPAAMAEACAALRIPLVHISTDYVFDGGGARTFAPNDATAPQNAYGRSKLAGEQGIRATGASHAILRTSWVFSAHGTNFVKTMLRLSMHTPSPPLSLLRSWSRSSSSRHPKRHEDHQLHPGHLARPLVRRPSAA
jgi:dTDP-4-dehydrorhamnose reductase